MYATELEPISLKTKTKKLTLQYLNILSGGRNMYIQSQAHFYTHTDTHIHLCKCLWRTEGASESPRAGVTDDSEMLDMEVLGTEHWSSARAASTLTCRAISPAPAPLPSQSLIVIYGGVCIQRYIIQPGSEQRVWCHGQEGVIRGSAVTCQETFKGSHSILKFLQS